MSRRYRSRALRGPGSSSRLTEVRRRCWSVEDRAIARDTDQLELAQLDRALARGEPVHEPLAAPVRVPGHAPSSSERGPACAARQQGSDVALARRLADGVRC